SVEAAWSATPVDAGTALVFTRAGPEFTLEPGIAGQRIGYRVRDGTLEVLYWPALDMPASVVPAAYELARGVTALRVDYLDSHGVWRERWPIFGEPAVPRGMRVMLRLASGDELERWIALR
ncbi:MAG TPA: type II secretion system protein GspJ, partial [Casimicrobiaceae bacterium]|nr:type II secretion system protein GspJ [Casimicrobiaceae bacterium]